MSGASSIRIFPLVKSSSLKEIPCIFERERAAVVGHCIYRVFDGPACMHARMNLPAAGRVASLMRCSAVLSFAWNDILPRAAWRADRFGLTTKLSVDSYNQCINRSLILFRTPPKHAEDQLNPRKNGRLSPHFTANRQIFAAYHKHWFRAENFGRHQALSFSRSE